MSAYKTVVVGTDGSPTSLRAVDRGAAMAARCGAHLILASAYLEPPRDPAHPDWPPSVDYKVLTDADVYGTLHQARSRARKAGAASIEERAVPGAPVEALLTLIDDVDADLLVIGSVGVNSIVGHVFGSVPSVLRRRVKIDLLIADTTDN